tara:strand:- start:2497 stop:3510 length:1014 start_codon:yes stop_codon:yes gene_type:complete
MLTETTAEPTATSAPAPGHQTLDEATNLLLKSLDPNQSTPTSQITKGQAQEAPNGNQGADTSNPDPAAADAPTGQADAAASDDDILAAMAPTETLEQQYARTKREAGASRAEALRLKKVEDGIKDIFSKQGLDFVLNDDGDVIGVAPNDKYNGGKSETAMALKFTDLTSDEQDRFESDPQALIDHVLNQARSGLVRVAPTVEKPIASLSPESEKANFEFLSGMVLEDGVTKKHPNLSLNETIIKQNLNAPTNKALKDFYNQQPDMAIALLDSYVDKTRSLIAGRAKLLETAHNNKQQEADSTITTGPSGGGVPSLSPNATVEQHGDAWSKEFGAAGM